MGLNRIRKTVGRLLRGAPVAAVPPDVPFQQRDGYETLHDDDDVAVLLIPDAGPDCLISFTGIGHAMGGVDVQTPEFARSGFEGPKLFIVDKRRSWGNALDWAGLQQIVAGVAGDRRKATLGNSMGAFLAVLAASRFGAEHCVALVPQWSVDPAVVPDEPRWQQYRQQIGTFRHRDLSRAFDTDCRFNLFFGDDPLDTAHARRFPAGRGNLDLFLLHGRAHNLARELKEAELLYPLIETCLQGGAADGVLAGAGWPFTRL